MQRTGDATIVCVADGSRGAGVLDRLPYPTLDGDAAEVLQSRWDDVDGFVLVMPATDATRLVGPLLGRTSHPPAVVVVDDAGRYAVPLAGDSHGEANDLARRVAAALDGMPVDIPSTAATDVPDLYTVTGLIAEGDVAGLTEAMRAGRRPMLVNPLEWPLPWALEGWAGDGPERIGITDELVPVRSGIALLRPPSLVIGVGTAPSTEPGAVWDLVIDALASANLSRSSVAEVVTDDERAGDPAITSLGFAVRSFSADDLARVPVPHPSVVVHDATGAPSLSEAAAFLGAGPGGRLLVVRRATGGAVLSIARRRAPKVVDARASVSPA